MRQLDDEVSSPHNTYSAKDTHRRRPAKQSDNVEKLGPQLRGQVERLPIINIAVAGARKVGKTSLVSRLVSLLGPSERGESGEGGESQLPSQGVRVQTIAHLDGARLGLGPTKDLTVHLWDLTEPESPIMQKLGELRTYPINPDDSWRNAFCNQRERCSRMRIAYCSCLI
jgi:hypothetical protein